MTVSKHSAINEAASNERIGSRIRQAREDAGFNSIAAAARACGFHPQNLADHEAGRRGVSIRGLDEYARAFDVSFLWLAKGDDVSSREEPLDRVLARVAIFVVGAAAPEPFPNLPTSVLLLSLPKVAGELRAIYVSRLSGLPEFSSGLVVYEKTTINNCAEHDKVVLRAQGRQASIYCLAVMRADGEGGLVPVYAPQSSDALYAKAMVGAEVVGRIAVSIAPEPWADPVHGWS